mgnify:FL=1
MGQKSHPIGLRLGIIRSWNSKWFAQRNFPDLLEEDLKIRGYINKRLENAGLARVEILRAPKKITVDIHSSRPGIVIGRKGAEVDKLREELQLLTKKDITLNIMEVKKPELDARLVADSIARQLEGRISFRRCMKKAIIGSMKMGAEGIKVMCSGRLGGAEIARSEKYMEGRVPLHTLRADIDYSTSTANTTYGTIGVKVWICRGEILDKPSAELAEDTAQPDMQRKRQAQQSRKRRPRPKSRVRKKRNASAEAQSQKAKPEEARSSGSQSAQPRGGADSKSPGGSSGKKPDQES